MQTPLNDINPSIPIEPNQNPTISSPKKEKKEKEITVNDKPANEIIHESMTQQPLESDLSDTEVFIFEEGPEESTDEEQGYSSDYDYQEDIETNKNLKGLNYVLETKSKIATLQPAIGYIGVQEYINRPFREDEHKEKKEQIISFLGNNLLVTSRLTGKKHKDYSAKLQRKAKKLNDDKLKPDNIAYLAEGQFKLVFKINLYVKNKIGEKSLKPVVLSMSKYPIQAIHNPILRNTLLNELDLMLITASDKKSGILPNYGVMQNEATGEFIIVTKYCNKGTLKDSFSILCQNNENGKITIMRQCWERIANLHKAEFTHRDIKLSNFLVHVNSNDEMKIYLADLGLAWPSAVPLKEISSSLMLLPPLTFKDNSKNLADLKLDNWSFGLMICNLMRMSDPQLSFDLDLNNDELRKILPWLKYTLENPSPEKIQEAEAQIATFIKETFEKVPFSGDEEINRALKQLVIDTMQMDPGKIINDEEIMKRLDIMFVKLFGPEAILEPAKKRPFEGKPLAPEPPKLDFSG